MKIIHIRGTFRQLKPEFNNLDIVYYNTHENKTERYIGVILETGVASMYWSYKTLVVNNNRLTKILFKILEPLLRVIQKWKL